MTYGFARQSGGHVHIYSELGVGTSVKFFISRSHQSIEPVHAPKTKTVGGQGEMVLIVEDDPSVRLIVTGVLGEIGYSVTEALDAASALPILQSNNDIDLLITDVGLPGIKGRQLAEIARQTRPELKALFITGYAQNAAVRSEFLDKGMDMLTKPFAMDALAMKLRDVFEG